MTEQKTILVDCHSHTSGISICCKKTPEEVIIAAKNVGIDGLILTNHYTMFYVNNKAIYPDLETMIQRYIDEYRYTKEIGEQYGIRVFFGIEASMVLYKGVHMLIYGVDENFLRKHMELCLYTQEELYRAVHKEGGVLVQAHPMRNCKNVLIDPAFLDGVEVSSHICYEGTHYDELSEFAYENGLILTSGGDYHGDTKRSFCGMYIPSSIENVKQFAEYLRTTDLVHLRMQESEDTESYEKIFIRNKENKNEQHY